MEYNRRKEEGYAIVEATVVYPIVVLSFFVIFYAAIILYHKASLQANLENAMFYFKSEISDNYIIHKEGIKTEDNARIGNMTEQVDYLNPYRNGLSFLQDGMNSLVGNHNEIKAKFEQFLKASFNVEFDELNIKINNYYLYKEFEVTAVKKIKTAINIEMIGGSNSVNLKFKNKIVVMNGDDFIRDVDFLADMLKDTAVGRGIEELKEKIKVSYEKLKIKLKI